MLTRRPGMLQKAKGFKLTESYLPKRYVWHVAPASALKSIQEHGLRPTASSSEIGSELKGRGEPGVHLLRSGGRLASKVATQLFALQWPDTTEKYVLLRVDLGKLDRDKFHSDPELMDHGSMSSSAVKGFFYSGSVPPEAVKLHSTNKIDKDPEVVRRRQKHFKQIRGHAPDRAGPVFFGPRGGKYRDPEHTIPWEH
jgi:hypothetical protein